MSFCKKCGQEIGTALQCPYCDTVITNEVTLPVYSNNNTQSYAPQNPYEQMQSQYATFRIYNLQMINDICVYFSAKREDFRKLHEMEERVVPQLSRESVAPLGWGIVLIIFFLIMAGFIIYSFISSTAAGMTLQITKADWPFIAVALSMLSLGIFLIVLYIVKGKKRKKKLAESLATLNELKQQLQDYYNLSPFVNTIGYEFVDPIVLDALFMIMKSGRANTISEAIQQFIFDVKNDELQRNMQMYNEELIRQIGSVRRWAKAGVGMSAANFGVSMIRWIL